MTSIQRHVADHAARSPGAPAILATDCAPLSYAQLNDRIDDTIASLRRLHVSAQARVAVALPERPDSGAGFGQDHHRDRLHGFTGAADFGHFFMALDPGQFMPTTEFTTRVDRLIAQARNGERAEGIDEILIPGEMELRNRARSLREGVRLRRSTYEALLSYGRKVGLRTRIEIAAHDDSVAGRAYAE